MTHSKIQQIENKYSSCAACSLGDKRRERKAPTCLGRGSLNPDLLVVIPAPIFDESGPPTPYDPESEEGKLFKQITDKIGIDRQKMYVIPAVACAPPKGERVTVKMTEACRPFLKEMLLHLNPKAVLLLGPEAMYAWTGQNVSKLMLGSVEADKERKVIWTYDFGRYLEAKKNDPDGASLMAKTLFEHWTEIADYLK